MKTKLLLALFLLTGVTLSIYAQESFDSLYNRAGNAVYEARMNNTDILLPDRFEEILDYFNEADEAKKSDENLSDAVNYLKQCLQKLEEIKEPLKNRQTAFDSVLKLRREAFNLNADLLAEEAWNTAEENFEDAIETFNDGETKEALSNVPQIQNNFKDAIVYANKAKMLIYNWSPLNDAFQNAAEVIAPDKFSDGVDLFYDALDQINDEENLTDVQNTILEAENNFEQATAKAKKFEDNFPDIIQRRKEAEFAGAEVYAPEVWETAEEMLKEAVSSFNDEENTDAKAFARKGAFKYVYARDSARKNYYVRNVELQIKYAKEEGAEKYAPVTLKQSITDLSTAKKMLIETDENFNKAIELIMKVGLEVKTAREITKTLKDINSGAATWEDEILKHNVVVSQKNALAPKSNMNKKTVLINAKKAFGKAKDVGAEKYSPKLYEQAREMLSLAEKELSKSDDSLQNVVAMADKAEDYSLQALKVSEIVSKVENKEESPEDVVKSWYFFLFEKTNQKPAVAKKAKTEKVIKPKKPVVNNLEKMFSPDEAVFLSHGKKALVKLTGIKFASGSSYLNKKSRRILNKFIAYLKNFPKAKLEIRCYTDNIGSVRYNKKISRKRAAKIKRYLVGNSDIPANNIITIGKGPSSPIATNRTRAGRRKNRRVEITVIKE